MWTGSSRHRDGRGNALRRTSRLKTSLRNQGEIVGESGRASETAMWNPFASMSALAGNAITIVHGHGSTVVDSTGREYLDAIASLWYCNVGYGRAELAEAAAEQMRELACFQVFEYYDNPPARDLCRRVADLAPVDGAKVFLTPGGGSDAVDTAGKL